MFEKTTEESKEMEKKSSFNLFEGWNLGEKDTSLREQLFDDDDDHDDGENHNFFEALQPNQNEGDEEETKRNKKEGGGWLGWVDTLSKLTSSEKDDGKALEALVDKARTFQKNAGAKEDKAAKSQDPMKKLNNELTLVFDQLKSSFGDNIDVKLVNPISIQCFLEKDESVKTPSWKRRKHRFLDELEFEKVYSLHDALYLAEASYLDSIEDVTEAVKDYKGASYVLVYCQTTAEPREPAHFIAIKKGKQKQTGIFPWQKENFLDVLMVVRGTKEISDMLSDALLGDREYCGGFAHDGVCQSGLYLVEKHAEFLEHLRKESGRDSIRLSLIGHSLGAGAASIACIEFNRQEKIEATCIGFGCPALLTKELSKKWESQITTVVCDADCVPRMSKNTMKNLLLDVMSNDWTSSALDEVKDLIDVLKVKIPFEIPQDKVDEVLDWVTSYLEKEIQPGIEKTRSTEQRSEVELFPPGKCIHLYRDGQGVSMHYVPCEFFSEFDMCYTMVDDHLIPTGYNRLLHEVARQKNNDSTFFFRNDVAKLRVESHRKEKKEKASDSHEGSEKS